MQHAFPHALYAALVAVGLAACGQEQDQPLQSNLQTGAAASAGREAPSGQAVCEGGLSEEAIVKAVVDACLGQVVDTGGSENGAPVEGDARAQFVGGLSRLVHPDGRLRRFGSGESYVGVRALDQAAKQGFAPAVYELGRRWQVDRRRADTPEQQNAVYASDMMFEIASRNGSAAGSLELARKHIYWGVHYNELNMGPESQTEYDQARRVLQQAATQENGRLASSAENLLSQLR